MPNGTWNRRPRAGEAAGDEEEGGFRETRGVEKTLYGTAFLMLL